MKNLLVIAAIIAVGLLAWRLSSKGRPDVSASSGLTSKQADKNAPPDESLITFAQKRTNAVRITGKPVKMYDRVAALCTMPEPDRRILQKQHAQHLKGMSLEDPHTQKYAHVFVSTEGVSAMRTNSVSFPRGTIILKEKFGDADGLHTELFTGMIKREPGYNPECGDWEFFTLPANAAKIASRGRLQSCMDCHVEYKDTDFVTHAYVP